MGAQAVAHSDSQRSKSAFGTTSVEISSTLKLAIEREQDLAVNTGAFIINDPNATESQFQSWVRSERLFARFPELLGIGNVELIAGDQLTHYERQSEMATGAAAGSFQIEPPGTRSFYCFATLTASPTGHVTTPPNFDLCATTLGAGFLRARDSGASTYLPYRSGRNTQLAVGTTIYQGGATPATVAARRAALLGFVGTQLDPHTLLATALHGHPHTAVAFQFGSGPHAVTFTAGRAPRGASATSVNLHNGWNVRVFQAVGGAGIFDSANSAAVLLGGTLITLLFVLLIYVLATSRKRALTLVKERTDELQHQALHDPLTGLANRALILDRLDHMLARARREHAPVAAFFIDLDEFKDINDTLGHAVGDELLVSVGARLASAVRQGDTVGRLGGDEFVVLVEGISLAEGATVLAARILDVLSASFEVPGSEVPLSVTASIGYVEGDRPSAGRMLQDADIALYQAKWAGKAQAMGFVPAMRDAVDGHRHLEVDLQGALEAGQFFLLYQPTVDLATGATTGVEALLRWSHPERGTVMPDEFIPALESSGLIIPVGAWVLMEACRQSVAWAEMGFPLVVSVNVSARQLERDRIVDDVSRAVSLSGIDPRTLVLELTETALMNNVEASMARLRLLKSLGVRIAIDDFGTGYSSLAYLRQFPIDVLKIDQTFVAGMGETPEAAALVHTLIQLGKVLGLVCVAEGIETDEQRILLGAEGVDIGQGYLFDRPLPPTELLARVRSEMIRSDNHLV